MEAPPLVRGLTLSLDVEKGNLLPTGLTSLSSSFSATLSNPPANEPRSQDASPIRQVQIHQGRLHVRSSVTSTETIRVKEKEGEGVVKIERSTSGTDTEEVVTEDEIEDWQPNTKKLRKE